MVKNLKLSLCAWNICRDVGEEVDERRDVKTEMALGESENFTLVWPAGGKGTGGVMGVVMNDAIRLKSLFIVSTIAGLHLHLVLLRSTSRQTQINDCLVPLNSLLSLHKPAVISDKDFHLLYSFIKHFFKLYHHKSHSVYLHCLFHYKWEWDEIVRHMDKSDSNWCGTVFCEQNQIVFPSLESQVSLRVYHRHLMLKGSCEHQPENWNQLKRMSSSFRNVPRWPWGQGYWCF